MGSEAGESLINLWLRANTRPQREHWKGKVQVLSLSEQYLFIPPSASYFAVLQFHFCRDDERQGWKDQEGGVKKKD